VASSIADHFKLKHSQDTQLQFGIHQKEINMERITTENFNSETENQLALEFT
jgi:hypothetical protein